MSRRMMFGAFRALPTSLWLRRVRRHLKALVKVLPKAYRVSGDPESGWIVCDFVDVVVHIFSAEARAYYQLEKLWTK